MIIQPNGIELDVLDDPTMGVPELICREIETYYELDLDYKSGDIVLDIGAHVGIVSCYLGKKYTFLRIFYYEPIAKNFQNAYRNLRVNEIYNCLLYPLAVTGDGRRVKVGYSPINSGSSSIFLNTDGETVDSKNIVEIVRGLRNIRLVKIDCEGAEYEIFESLERNNLLKRISSVRGELHGLPDKSPQGLIEMLKKHIPDVRLVIGGPIGA